MKIGFISDIHEDIKSLEKVISLLKKNDADITYCLGDITGYSHPYYNYDQTRDAGKCIDLVQQNCENAVLGNHDLYVLKRTPRFTEKFIYPENWYKLSTEKRKKLSHNKIWFYDHSDLPVDISQNQYNYLNSLCEFEIISHDNQMFFLSHFIYPDLSGSTINYPKSKYFFKKHFHFMAENNCNIAFCGHGHYNGAGVCTKKDFSILKPGIYTVDRLPGIIIVPCIAKSKSMNGTTIFNTETYELEVISINDQ